METDEHNPVYRDPNLLIVFGVTLTAVMGVSSITPAFPKIAEQFGVTPERTGLLITAYYVPGIVLTPILGFLSDHWGRRPILGPSLLLFAVAGALCGVAPDFEVLLVLRFLQGAGAASLAALNLTIIGDLFEGERRTEAMGYNASVLSVGTAAYPSIGGALALFGWYYPFVLPLLAIPTGLVVLTRLENPEPEGDQALGEYMREIWSVLQSRQVIGVFILGFVTFVVLFGPYLTYFPILMDETFGSSSLVIGLVMSSVSVASGITAARLGDLSRRFSKRTLLVVAFLLYTATFAAMPYVGSIWAMLVPSATYGIAQGLNIPSLQALLAGIAPMEQRGAFMSFNGLINRVGQTLGPVAAGGLYAIWGFEGVYLGAAALTFATLAPLLFAIRG